MPSRPPSSRSSSRPPSRPFRLLITAGPTHEPIDSVRFLGNRSSGRLGVALAELAAARGCTVTLLLGPTSIQPADSLVRVRRFRTTAELQALLQTHFPRCDALIMAAAVADYRPRTSARTDTKLRRQAAGLTLHLDPTPDLLAQCAAARRHDQILVGFALEPRSRLIASARRKLVRKRIDLIVANPLAAMDSDRIEAAVMSPLGVLFKTARPISKRTFARRLLAIVRRAHKQRA